ncbi:hypothetical protein ACEF14_04245 [Weissella paramesenteroides]
MKEFSYRAKICKMLLLLLFCIIGIVSIIYCEIKKISIGSTLGGLVAGFLLPYLFTSFADLTDNTNWKSTQRKLLRAGLIQKDTIIRISFAYLYRIKIDGRYFLVQNTRTNKYQPVGGAYKFELEEANYLAENIPVENDNRIPVDKITKRDYRLLIKSKYLRKFVKRFDKTPYRENINDLSREFFEEVFSVGILDKREFGDLSYKYCGRHMTNVEYSNVFNYYELLLADVVEVRLTANQEDLFRNLIDKGFNKYRFATFDEIKSYGVGYGTDKLIDSIANHTPKILSENTDKLTLRNKYEKTIKIKI